MSTKLQYSNVNTLVEISITFEMTIGPKVRDEINKKLSCSNWKYLYNGLEYYKTITSVWTFNIKNGKMIDV